MTHVCRGIADSPAMPERVADACGAALDRCAAQWVTDADGTILHVNDTLCRLAGLPREALLGRSDAILVPPPKAPGGRHGWQVARAEGRAWAGPFEGTRPDGGSFRLDIVATPLPDEAGRPGHTVITGTDATALLAAEAALADAAARLDTLSDLSQVGAWSLAPGAAGPVWDDKVREIHEAPAGFAPTRDSALEFYAPEARGVLADAIDAALDKARPFDIELPLVSWTGREAWVRAVGRPVIRDGRVVRLDGVFQDVTERHGRAAAVQRLQARFEAIVQNTPVAISLRDRFGTIHLANRRYETIAGRGNLAGLFESDLFPEPVAERLEEHDRAAIAAGRPVVSEDTYVNPDGSATTLLTARFTIEDAVLGDKVVCAIGADITEQKTLQARLEQARAEAEAATRAKADFLSTISHEIRTPMNGVIGMAESLFDTDLTDEQRRGLAVIRDSGRLLVTLLNDLLDFAKVERGAIALEAIAFEPESVVAAVLPAHAAKAAAKGVALEADIDPAARAPRLGDPMRLQQILHNLLGNAVKFTDTGRVRLRLAADAAGRLVLAVSDTGIGMTPEQAERVFDSFTQADPSIARRFGGTGLGLSIVKGLAAAMGGEIRLDTRPSLGSTFTVALPLPPAPAAAAEPVRPEVPRAALAGRTALVADDNEVNRLVLTAFLERLGVTVLAVNGGEAAVAAARDGRFDALLLDVVMPDLDGPDALARIHAEAAAAGRLSPPAVAVTGQASTGEIEACLAAGFAAHLGKPIDQERLLAVLSGVIGARPTRP